MAFLSGNSGSVQVFTNSGFNFNPSTGSLSAISFTGNSATATTATTAGSATTATNLAGGADGDVPYQTGSGTTAFVPAGTSGYILQSNGAAAPTWVAPTVITTLKAGWTFINPANTVVAVANTAVIIPWNDRTVYGPLNVTTSTTTVTIEIAGTYFVTASVYCTGSSGVELYIGVGGTPTAIGNSVAATDSNITVSTLLPLTVGENVQLYVNSATPGSGVVGPAAGAGGTFVGYLVG
jgi:hypothetical protein